MNIVMNILSYHNFLQMFWVHRSPKLVTMKINGEQIIDLQLNNLALSCQAYTVQSKCNQ